MGTPLDSFFFTQKKYSVSVSGTFGRTDQKFFRYDQRSSKMILWKRGNFGESKLLWAYNDSKFISEVIFRLFEIESKSCFILTRINYHAPELNENQQNGSMLHV